MSEIKLKPCPFCGGEARINKGHSRLAEWYTVSCSKCHVTQTVRYIKPEKAIEAWNTRADADIRAKTIDDCMNEIREYAINAYDWEIGGELAHGKIGHIQEGLYEAYERLQMIKEDIAEQMKGR